jgi:hypothetical protein
MKEDEMPQKDPSQMTTGEVVEQARKAGIKNPERMNKEQMLRAMGYSPPQSAQPGQGGGQGDTPPPRGSDPKQWKNIPGNQS